MVFRACRRLTCRILVLLDLHEQHGYDTKSQAVESYGVAGSSIDFTS